MPSKRREACEVAVGLRLFGGGVRALGVVVGRRRRRRHPRRRHRRRRPASPRRPRHRRRRRPQRRHRRRRHRPRRHRVGVVAASPESSMSAETSSAPSSPPPSSSPPPPSAGPASSALAICSSVSASTPTGISLSGALAGAGARASTWSGNFRGHFFRLPWVLLQWLMCLDPYPIRSRSVPERASTIRCDEPDARSPAAGARPAVDDAHVRRAFDGAQVQRAVPLEPRQGADRAVDRLRPADPDRLRRRPRARARRGRQGRRADRPPRRDGRAHGRHPAGDDEHVDDDQRDGGLAAGAVHRHGRGARASIRASCRARRRTTSSRSSSRAGRTPSRPRRRCG